MGQVKRVLELKTMYTGSKKLLLHLDIEVDKSTTAKELGELVEERHRLALAPRQQLLENSLLGDEPPCREPRLAPRDELRRGRGRGQPVHAAGGTQRLERLARCIGGGLHHDQARLAAGTCVATRP